MKKVSLVILACLLMMAANAYAVTREVQYNLEDQTNFGKVGVAGANNTGNPGYVSFIAPNYAGVNFTYYLWVNGGGKLCLASYPTISAYSSFPTGNWNDQNPGMGCTVVGSQS